MSQGSSNPASPSRPVMASEQQETLTPVSHIFGLSEVSASLEALNIEVERKPTVVHHAQASYSQGASMTPWSPNARDHWRSTRKARASHEVERVPYLNLDAFSRFIGPKNWGQALINNELTTCLLDNGAQLNFITPAYAVERGMDIMSLDRLAQEIRGLLPLIAGMGGSLVEPTGFVLMNVKVPCVQGYDEDQVALVMDDLGMTECPVILGTSTLYRVMEVIKESEISKLAVPWSSS